MTLRSQASLYIVSTPIGNLEDITFRAISTLKAVDLILAEDTRTSGKLLKHYNINTPMQSFHLFNEKKQLDKMVIRMKQGDKIAIISDAGTPGISDPGYILFRECLENELDMECIPGATALIPALLKSGLPSDKFVFEGFLPHKKGRNKILSKLSTESRTMIFYESPHRLLKTLHQFITLFGPERKVSVSRELTKMHEETINGSLDEVLNIFEKKNIKGEFVLVVAGIDSRK